MVQITEPKSQNCEHPNASYGGEGNNVREKLGTDDEGVKFEKGPHKAGRRTTIAVLGVIFFAKHRINPIPLSSHPPPIRPPAPPLQFRYKIEIKVGKKQLEIRDGLLVQELSKS